MASSSKSQLLDKIRTTLAKRYKLGPREGKMSVLEAVLYGICHEGSTREQANQAIGRFRDAFFDWNELRVSSLPEIQDALAGLPGAETKAQRVRKFLRLLFERTYGFELDQLGKKPLKESVKVLQDYEPLQSDFVLATVIQQALGGHAIPVDEPIRRALVRLGVAEDDAPAGAIRSTLERAVSKSHGAEFGELLEELAHDTCVDEPDCPACALIKLCPTGQARAKAARSTPAPPSPSDQGTSPATPRRSSRGGSESAPTAAPKAPRGRSPRPK